MAEGRVGEAVNSRTYWDRRFAGDWDSKGGREQSRVFMELLASHLPGAVYDEISARSLSLLDCGCAAGDGTAVLARRFPRSAVAGCDFSKTAIDKASASYPEIEFFVADLTTLERRADVLVSSNCFEHLEQPISALRRLLGCARRYVVLLTPYLEQYPFDPEHLHAVHTATFPQRLDEWRLSHRIVLPPSPVWSGLQLLSIYEPAEVAAAGDESTRFLESALAALSIEVRSLSGRNFEAVDSLVRQLEQARAAATAQEAARALERRLEWQRRRLDVLENGLAQARDLADRRGGELARLAGERDRLEQEHLALAARMAQLEGARAVRLVFRLWRSIEALLPAGTRRRRLYERALGRSPRPVAPPITPEPALAPVPGAPAALPDFCSELAWFEDVVAHSRAPLVVTLFAGTQLRESEGQRPTQLALELSRRGVPVVFAYWRWSTGEWCPQDRLAEGILQLPLDRAVAEPGLLAGSFAGRRRIALFELPYPGFFELVAALNGAGWITAYDVLDDWSEFHRAGQALWYDEAFERHLLTAVDAVFAVHPALAARVLGLGARQVEVVPNGLRAGIERAATPRALEPGAVTVGYFGHLSEAWFDWDLMIAAAESRPAWRFYLIGYGCDPAKLALPANLVLLGKQPQSELAAYAANWDVAVVPFQDGPLAAAADPIKVYEYLAMGLPVVVTGVTPPLGGEALVRRAEGLEDFLTRLEEAARDREAGGAGRRQLALSCTWARRVDRLLEVLERGGQRVGEKESLFAEGK